MNDENKLPTPPEQPPVPPVAPPPPIDPSSPASDIRPPAPAPTPGYSAPTAPITPAQAVDLTTGAGGPAPTPEPESHTMQTVGSGVMAVVGTLFSWVVFPLIVVLVLHNFVFQAYHVLGTSMVPTLHNSDYLIISKVGYTEALIGRMFGKNDLYLPKRGQVIVFHYPKDPTEIFVKRVVGLPGDRVVVKNGQVTVYNKDNPKGFDPDSKYENANTTTLIDTDEVVQSGNLFVMGDNRTPNGSYDSREWGQLPSSYIIGNAVLRLLPLDQTKIL